MTKRCRSPSWNPAETRRIYLNDGKRAEQSACADKIRTNDGRHEDKAMSRNRIFLDYDRNYGYCLVLLTFSLSSKKKFFYCISRKFSGASHRSPLIGYCLVLLTFSLSSKKKFFYCITCSFPGPHIVPFWLATALSCWPFFLFLRRTVPRLLFGELKITSGYFEVVDEQVVQKLRGNTLKLEGTVRATCQFLHGVGWMVSLSLIA